jgi:hypothetical protein
MICAERNGRLTVFYRCEAEGCLEAGKMSFLLGDPGTIDCPGECGSKYLPWKGPDGKWRLKSVVLALR